MPVSVRVINLNANDDRWKRISKQLTKKRVEFWRSPGVLPENITKQYFSNSMLGAPDIMGHVACANAHLNAWDSVKESKDFAVILEDDVELCGTNFNIVKIKEIVESVEASDRNWEIILLGWGCDNENFGSCIMNPFFEYPDTKGSINIVKPKRYVGLWGYLINTNRIEHIKTKICPLNMCIDHALYSYGVNVFACLPHLVKHPGKIRVTAANYTAISRFPYNSYTNKKSTR